MSRSAALAWVGLATLLISGTPAHAQSAAHARTGRIEGMAVVAPTLATRKARFRIYSDVGAVSAPARRRAEPNEVENLIIYLESAPSPPWATEAVRAADRARGRLAVEQLHETFVPHVLPVLKGSTVAFPNGDFVFHNVFSLSKARSFDLGRYPKGESKSVRLERPGIVQVFCHIHSDMSAVVFVLDNPFFAAPNSTGRFALEGIPPGEYRVIAWHERIKPVSRRVRVIAGETAQVNFNIPLPDEPQAP